MGLVLRLTLFVGFIATHGECGLLHSNGHQLMIGGERVFLNGVNQAWVHYAHDFGNHGFNSVRGDLERYLRELHESGGNSIRIWLHIEGESTPHFTGDGHVDKTDAAGSLIQDMRDYLRLAAQYDILVFWTLWNGAKNQQTHYRLNGLIRDTGKLQSYIDHALVPMVNALKNEPALGGWDIINEPEGELKPGEAGDSCTDTRALAGSGAGWEGHLYTAHEIQRFINWQADAIHNADPSAMITVGSWNMKANTDRFGFKNLYKDECLRRAGGRQNGVLTFYQTHTYGAGHWDGYSPFQHHYNDYGLDKPLVVGEFRQKDSPNTPITDLYNYAYYYGYSGAWGWQAVEGNWGNLRQGINWLRGRNDQAKGGKVTISV